VSIKRPTADLLGAVRRKRRGEAGREQVFEVYRGRAMRASQRLGA